jgi:DNA mismatch repair protein MutS
VPDAILLFRMGDFYELFYDDAELAARLLGITLTSRDSGKTPLAGIPYHALDGYLAKLVAAGHKVAISEQTQDAKDAKGVVDRAIVRIVTPGTLTEDGLLDRSQANVVAALYPYRSEVGVAALELSTGQFTVLVLDVRKWRTRSGGCRRQRCWPPDDLAGLRPDWLELSRARVRSAVDVALPGGFHGRPGRSRCCRSTSRPASLEGFGFTRGPSAAGGGGAAGLRRARRRKRPRRTYCRRDA